MQPRVAQWVWLFVHSVAFWDQPWPSFFGDSAKKVSPERDVDEEAVGMRVAAHSRESFHRGVGNPSSSRALPASSAVMQTARHSEPQRSP
jgi:hypothetical protein